MKRREPLFIAILMLLALFGFTIAALVSLALGDDIQALVLAVMALVVVEAGR